MERTLDLNADVTLDMMKVYVDAPEGTPELKDQLEEAARRSTAARRSHARSRTSLRRRLADYRERMDELHAQIVTLQAVKTGGDLMTHLKTKMKDISDRVQKTTIAIVDAGGEDHAGARPVPGRARRADAARRDPAHGFGRHRDASQVKVLASGT